MKNSISYRGKTKIVAQDNKRYICKVKRQDKTPIFNYLKSKDFANYLPYTEVTNEYEIYRYLEDNLPEKEDKAIELIYTLSLLHAKTTTYQEIDLDYTKKIYEDTKSQLAYLRNYYLDLQDFLETKIYPSPAEYLVLNNISKFYKAINYSEQKIESWYQEKIKLKKERLVLLHNNLTLDHFIKDDIAYLISWDKAKKGLVIFDFLNFYKNEYLNVEMTSLFDIYQSKYHYSKDELLLFQALISIPEKITFKKTNYINTVEAKNKIIYIDKTNDFLSKYYEKNQKSNNQELKEQNNSV